MNKMNNVNRAMLAAKRKIALYTEKISKPGLNKEQKDRINELLYQAAGHLNKAYWNYQHKIKLGADDNQNQ